MKNLFVITLCLLTSLANADTKILEVTQKSSIYNGVKVRCYLGVAYLEQRGLDELYLTPAINPDTMKPFKCRVVKDLPLSPYGSNGETITRIVKVWD